MSKRITVHAPDELLRDVRTYAAAQGMSFSEAVRDLIRIGLGEDPDERGRRQAFTRALAVVREALAEAAGELD